MTKRIDPTTTAADRAPEGMTEAELADYFYLHRDDLAGEEVPSRPPLRGAVDEDAA